MSKVNQTVVRNAAYTRGGVSVRERHNERKNEAYANADVCLERSSFNVHYKSCEGTYIEAFDKLLADGVISTRGLKEDSSTQKWLFTPSHFTRIRTIVLLLWKSRSLREKR